MTGEVPPYQAVHGKMGNLGLPVRRETEHEGAAAAGHHL